MKKGNRGHRNRVRTVAACLLLVLLVGTVTSLAQDEDLYSQAPEIDLTPVEISRTEVPGGVNVLIEVPAWQDTYVTSGQPGTNWCGSNWLRLGYSKDSPGYGAERIFLKFNLSTIPPGAAINDAWFKIYQHTSTPAGDGDMRVESRHLLADWDQCQITWDSHQPQWGPVFGSSWVPGATGWLEADATKLVRDWVYGTHPNHGAMLMGDETVRERQRIFYSSRDTSGRYPRLYIDFTEHTDDDPPQVSIDALPQWSPHRFIVTWSGADPGGSGIAYYDVEYRVPGEGWIQWRYHTGDTSAEFVGGANGTTYEFRARGVDNAGNVQSWGPNAQASTRVDSVPPSVTVEPLPTISFASSAVISWSGSDDAGGSGIQTYDVQYQIDGGSWQDWLVGTTATSSLATGGQTGVTYGFRARATDNVGNVQPWSATAQATTKVDTQAPVASILPFPAAVTGADQFLVRWTGDSSPSTLIVAYDVRYRFGDGPWTAWQSQTQLTQASFTALQPVDGVYCFQAQTTDTAGRTSGYMGQQCIAVDREPPYIEPLLWLPAVARN